MFTTKLLHKENLTADIWSFLFEVPRHFDWWGGEHTVLVLEHPNHDEKGTARALSIATLPFEKHLQFVTHCPEKGSSFKHALRELPLGGEVSLTPAQPSFKVPVGTKPGEPAVLIAGGVGVASMRSILVERHHNKEKLNAKLYYYAPKGQHFFVDDFAVLSANDTTFEVKYFADEGLQEQGGIKEADEVSGTTYYFSGVYTREMLLRSEIAEHVAGPESQERKEVELLSKATGLLQNP